MWRQNYTRWWGHSGTNQGSIYSITADGEGILILIKDQYKNSITLDGDGILILNKDQYKDSITLDSEYVLVLFN